jgi:hypothetical protein
MNKTTKGSVFSSLYTPHYTAFQTTRDNDANSKALD